MWQRLQLKNLNDYFLPAAQRPAQGVYCYRFLDFSAEVEAFLCRYYEEARQNGAVLEGKLANPTEQNLAYYREILGTAFKLQPAFFAEQLGRWLPRLSVRSRQITADALYDVLLQMAQHGKNETMLKNAYMKFMCWLYYRFERVVQSVEGRKVPKIFYEGSVSYYELEMLHLLSRIGCDLVLLDISGDSAYGKLDPQSRYTHGYQSGGRAFPADYKVRSRRQTEQLQRESTVPLAGKQPCINAWLSGDILQEVQKPVAQRGDDAGLYYTVFARFCGVEEKATYLNMLLQLYLQLEGALRPVVVLDQKLALPSAEEIGKIQRRKYTACSEMMADLAQNIVYGEKELQQIIRQQFVQFWQEEAVQEIPLNRLLNKAVYLLCWLKRYGGQLFGKWKQGQQGAVLILNDCGNENEVLFFRFLARLPLDVLIFSPNLDLYKKIEDKYLFEKKYTISMTVEQYPRTTSARMGTVAYHAEQELTETLYRDSGMYREQQYQKGRAIALETMYEEIYILWEQENCYRPNFQVVQEEVLMPVLLAKVSGVKDGNVQSYWNDVRKLVTADTFLITEAPFYKREDANPMRQYAAEFLRHRKVQKQKIKQHKAYPYGYLREEMQEYMLDKLQELLDLQLIRGTYQNGTEYTVIATILNLNKELVRLIQKMDFTKVPPKAVFLHTGEQSYSLEDGILLAYLHLLGFDVVLFVPTGYCSMEQYYQRPFLTEHKIGTYLYDLKVPDRLYGHHEKSNRSPWWENLWKRGRS